MVDPAPEPVDASRLPVVAALRVPAAIPPDSPLVARQMADDVERFARTPRADHVLPEDL